MPICVGIQLNIWEVFPLVFIANESFKLMFFIKNKNKKDLIKIEFVQTNDFHSPTQWKHAKVYPKKKTEEKKLRIEIEFVFILDFKQWKIGILKTFKNWNCLTDIFTVHG